PVVARRTAEHDPLIGLGKLEEGLDPRSRSDQTLLIKYEEGVLDVDVVPDVVPGVDSELHSSLTAVPIGRNPKPGRLPLPVKTISLPGGGNNVKVSWGWKPLKLSAKT